VRVFTAMIEARGIDGVQCLAYGGKTALRGFLKNRAAPPEWPMVRGILVTQDANGDPGAAFASVRDALTSRGLASPRAPGEVTQGPPNVAVWILPGAGRLGMLEDLCLDTLAGDPVLQCVDAFTECVAGSPKRVRVEGPEDAQSTVARLAKRRVQAWAAACDPPQRRLGELAQKGGIDFSHSAFDPLVSLIRRL
jgi:hypothetical protein